MCVVDWHLVLEFFKVIVAWPVIGGLLIAYFLKRFFVPIAAFIDRVRKAKILGAEMEADAQAEANASPSATAAAAIVPKDSTVAGSPAASGPSDAQAPSTAPPSAVVLNVGGDNRTVEVAQASSADEHASAGASPPRSNGEQTLGFVAETWHFFYLNYFFALSTQLTINVLDLAGPDGIWSSRFDIDMQARISSPTERAAVLKALIDNGMIFVGGSKYRLSPAGWRYAAWEFRAVTPNGNTEEDMNKFVESLRTLRAIQAASRASSTQ